MVPEKFKYLIAMSSNEELSQLLSGELTKEVIEELKRRKAYQNDHRIRLRVD